MAQTFYALVRVTVENADGTYPTGRQLEASMIATKSAIQSRLSEGFLPDDVFLTDATVSVIVEDPQS